MQVKANAVASAADIVFFFFINYIFLNLFFEVKQMPSSLKNTHSQLRITPEILRKLVEGLR